MVDYIFDGNIFFPGSDVEPLNKRIIRTELVFGPPITGDIFKPGGDYQIKLDQVPGRITLGKYVREDCLENPLPNRITLADLVARL